MTALPARSFGMAALAGTYRCRSAPAAALSLEGAGRSRARVGGVECAIDGRIANAPELRRLLGSGAPRDIAALLASAYCSMGRALLTHLRGEFAVLLWEPDTGEGVLARDQLGARSLHYKLEGSRLYFGSEVRDLLPLLPVRPSPDRLAINHWVAMQDVRGGRTFFEGVRALPSGHLIDFGPGGAEIRCWWSPRYAPVRGVTLEEAAGTVRQSLATAVERACEPGAPIGVLMSGGLDSTGVAALAAAIRPGIGAYSGVFPTMPSVDESVLVERAAESIGVHSVRMPVEARGVLVDAASFGAAWEVPLCAQALGHWLPLMRRAGDDGVRVMLDGEGGDLLFGAAHELIADRLRALRPLSALRLARRLRGVRCESGATRYVLRVHGLSAALPPAVQLARRRRNPTRYMPPWLPPAAARDLSVAAGDLDYKRMAGPRWWARLADGFGAGLDAVGIRDTVRRRAAMAGLDARSPFFDVDLVELVLSLPPELSFHPELTRPVQREAMRGLLPDSIRLRPVKSYFDELLQRSFAVEDLDAVQSLLGARDAELGAYVDLHAVRRELLGTTPGRNPHGVRFWMAASWRLATAELWLRREAERSSGASLQGALVAP